MHFATEQASSKNVKGFSFIIGINISLKEIHTPAIMATGKNISSTMRSLQSTRTNNSNEKPNIPTVKLRTAIIITTIISLRR